MRHLQFICFNNQILHIQHAYTWTQTKILFIKFIILLIIFTSSRENNNFEKNLDHPRETRKINPNDGKGHFHVAKAPPAPKMLIL